MRPFLKYTFLVLFCGLFLMQSVATAQDKSTEPQTGKPAKTEKIEKPQKPEKSEKNPNGLAPITLKDLAVEFPDVDGWEKSDIQKYPTEDLGFSINYESTGGGRVTVYVYNGGRKDIPNGSTDKIIKDELNNVKNEIRKAADMGYYENLNELKNDTVTLDGTAGKVKALRTLYNFSARGTELTSEVYIFGHQKRFIKIRATRPLDEDKAGNKMVTELLAEIAAVFSN